MFGGKIWRVDLQVTSEYEERRAGVERQRTSRNAVRKEGWWAPVNIFDKREKDQKKFWEIDLYQKLVYTLSWENPRWFSDGGLDGSSIGSWRSKSMSWSWNNFSW